MAKKVLGQFPWKNTIISRSRNTKGEKNWTKMSRNGTLSFRGVCQSAGGLLGSKWGMREATVNKKLFLHQKISWQEVFLTFPRIIEVISVYKQLCFQKWPSRVLRTNGSSAPSKEKGQGGSSQEVKDGNWVSLAYKLLNVWDVWKWESHPTPTVSGWQEELVTCNWHNHQVLSMFLSCQTLTPPSEGLWGCRIKASVADSKYKSCHWHPVMIMALSYRCFI